MSSNEIVLVTGGNGFVASYCILAAIQQGYRVRATIRNLKRTDEVRQMLKIGGATDDQVKDVAFFAADLTSDDGWHEAIAGCSYILHVASPFPLSVPKDPNELIKPAKEGTLRVLRIAKSSGTVKRVVITGSFAAIGYGYGQRAKPFTEADWTCLDDPAHPVAPYQQSKTIAERAAWDWIAKEGGSLELCVLNPAGIFGPILSKNIGTSIELVARLMNGQVPGLPNLMLGCVDVRDLADVHIRTMKDPRAKSERFIVMSDEGYIWTKDLAEKLKAHFGERAKKVPTRVVPNLALRFLSYFDRAIALITPELGKAKATGNEKTKRLLNWQPMSAEETLAASVESLYRFGLIK